MFRFELSEALGRKIRQDDWSEIGVPTWVIAREAIEGGRTEEALELVDYGRFETNKVRSTEMSVINFLINYIADKYGEDEVGKAWREDETLGEGIRVVDSLTVLNAEDRVRRVAEGQRGHHCGRTGIGDLTISEEADRYVITTDPCGGGGRWKRDHERLSLTKKAHPWSWGKVGVTYWCTHCCIWYEIMSIERLGYPVKIHENVDKPQEPCLQIIYKSPELIPEHYFTRVGMKKDISKFTQKDRS
ncbi:hypothetical protein ACFLVG_05265 [Chloroflexota bacterium]